VGDFPWANDHLPCGVPEARAFLRISVAFRAIKSVIYVVTADHFARAMARAMSPTEHTPVGPRTLVPRWAGAAVPSMNLSRPRRARGRAALKTSLEAGPVARFRCQSTLCIALFSHRRISDLIIAEGSLCGLRSCRPRGLGAGISTELRSALPFAFGAVCQTVWCLGPSHDSLPMKTWT
jgi:hypothetical protein